MYPEQNFNSNSDRQYMPTPAEYSYAMSNVTTYVRPSNMIYVNKNIVNPTNTKVLVNPKFSRHFHVNPNFTNKSTPSTTIFVNPNVFKQKATQPSTSTSTQIPNHSLNTPTNAINVLKYSQKQPVTTPTATRNYNQTKAVIVSKYSKINSGAINHNIASTETVIKTKTKFVRVHATSSKPTTQSASKVIPPTISTNVTKMLPAKISISKNIKTKRIVSRHKLVKINNNNVPKPVVRNKYKLIRTASSVPSTLSSSSNCKLVRQPSLASANAANRFKLDNRRQSYTIIKSRYKLTKKAYMMRLDPQNTIIKNTKFKLIRSLKNDKVRKVSDKSTSPRKTVRTPGKSKKFVKKNLVKINNRKLKKNNIPCEMYNKKGKCKGLANGKCSKKHDPNQIQICIWFLQGICRDDNCTLSHKVSPEKMPTCKFFLEGMCHKDDCPYLHVKLSKDAPVCVDFLNGYCAKGLECDKRHQFLCPDYEKDGKCNKKLCRYPHGKAVRQYKDTLLKRIARNRKSKAPTRIQEVKAAVIVHAKNTQQNKTEEQNVEADTKRYYECGDTVKPPQSEHNDVVDEQGVNVFDRPKLGALPSFISF